MGELSPGRAQSSTSSAERNVKFGTIVRALWPHKPALNLAQRIGCSERAAQFYIDGERKPSARAVYSIIAEILD
jgi:hypothetical protein